MTALETAQVLALVERLTERETAVLRYLPTALLTTAEALRLDLVG